MEIQNFKLINKGFVVGRFDLHIPEWGGQTIRECTCFSKNNNKWIALPQREFKTPDNKRGFIPLVKFDAAVFKKMQETALQKIEELLSTPQAEAPSVQEDEHLNLPF
jgi:hypothetical protein